MNKALKIFKYRFLSKCLWGRKRNHYKMKLGQIKHLDKFDVAKDRRSIGKLLKEFKYKVLSKLLWGKKRIHYKTKLREMRHLNEGNAVKGVDSVDKEVNFYSHREDAIYQLLVSYQRARE